MAKRILVIDDDPVVVKYLTTLFSDNGYETDTASNGVEGMEKLKSSRPDLITLDLEMPEEWGSRLYRKMSKDDELKDIPIIVISGMAGRHAVKSAAAYVAKPFDPDKLLGIVKRTIG
jgi:CheY-like chemotaxis protein